MPVAQDGLSQNEPRHTISLPTVQLESSPAQHEADDRPRLRLMLAASEGLILELLAHHVGRRASYVCVATTSSFNDVVPTCGVARPHVVIMAVKDNPQGTVATVSRLREEYPDVGAVVLAFDKPEAMMGAVLAAGARGFMTSDGSIGDLDRTIDEVAMGGIAVDTSAVSDVVQSLTGRRARPSLDQGVDTAMLVTVRERDVLRLLAEGLPTASIAEELGISLHTTRTHIKKIMLKLGAHSRLEAAALAVRRGLV